MNTIRSEVRIHSTKYYNEIYELTISLFNGSGSSGTSTSTGKVVRVLTQPDQAGSTGVTVKASENDPRYEVF